MPLMKDASLIKALEIVGGPVELGRRLSISSQAISQWQKVPATRVIAVEKATHGQVSRSEMRPDLYPPVRRPRKSHHAEHGAVA